MNSIFGSTSRLAQTLKVRSLKVRASPVPTLNNPEIFFKGKEVLTWSINNYLGLSNHPDVREADTEASKKWGLGYPMGARMMSGNSIHHEKLEKELSTFVQKEDSILLNYGYQGVLSIVDSLLDRKDVVVYDSECHACIIDGLRMHIGKRFVERCRALGLIQNGLSQIGGGTF